MKKLIILIIILLIVFLTFNKLDLKNKILMKIYKTDYIEYVDKYSKKYGVDNNLIFAIIKAESNFNEKSISNKGAKGLMQLMPITAEEVGEKIDVTVDEENIFSPDININLGTQYISSLIEKYGNINLAVAAYNAGSGNVDNWISEGTIFQDGSNIENVPFTETNNYVRKILRDYKIYKELYS